MIKASSCPSARTCADTIAAGWGFFFAKEPVIFFSSMFLAPESVAFFATESVASNAGVGGIIGAAGSAAGGPGVTSSDDAWQAYRPTPTEGWKLDFCLRPIGAASMARRKQTLTGRTSMIKAVVE